MSDDYFIRIIRTAHFDRPVYGMTNADSLQDVTHCEFVTEHSAPGDRVDVWLLDPDKCYSAAVFVSTLGHQT